jgi:Transcriptional regulator
MELNQLKQLVTIAKYGNISKAAEELLISQPALSRSMKRLEEDLKVSLFDHYTNKVILNQNGELVVNYANKILNEINSMVAHVQKFNQSHLSITMACCAPAPIWELEVLIKKLYPYANIFYEIIDQKELLQELRNGTYTFVLTPFKVKCPDTICYPYIKEDLYVSLPQQHHLKDKKEISFQEIDGEMMILYSNIGFWYDMHLRTMPNTKFLIQNERMTFNEIVKASTLPSFTSNLSIKREGKIPNRIIIPISDDLAHITFYLILLKQNKNKYMDLIKHIKS